MSRLIRLLGAVLALALSGTASADTFRVARPHTSGGGGSVAFSPGGTVIPFTRTAQAAHSGPLPFAAVRSIWQAAGNSYGIPWTVLAAINKVETNFGQNLGPSSAGAIGWMQFMPSTWARWGIDANGDGIADPDNRTDAIFSAARYLAGRLQKRLDAANRKLGRFRDEAGGALFATNAAGLFTGTLAGADQSGAVSIALQYLGVPYKWAGATPRGGFDCSGLVQYVYAQLGVSLPHNTVLQWNDPRAVSVPRDQLQPGDLVFFNGLDHVGIYIGNGDFIDAPHTGAFVRT